jgi:hypothetical protein
MTTDKLFYLASFEKDSTFNRYQNKETKILAKLGSSPSTLLFLSKDNKTFLYETEEAYLIDKPGKIRRHVS